MNSKRPSGVPGWSNKRAGQEPNVVWLTPPEIIQALGPFDLDPCAAVGQPWRTAAVHYTEMEDGLAHHWFGFVWCNPPFGSGRVEPWLSRMGDHGNGIALVPARTETRWFNTYVWQRANAILFLTWRPYFHLPTGERPKSTIGVSICLVAYGAEAVRRLASGRVDGVLVRWGSEPPDDLDLFADEEPP